MPLRHSLSGILALDFFPLFLSFFFELLSKDTMNNARSEQKSENRFGPKLKSLKNAPQWICRRFFIFFSCTSNTKHKRTILILRFCVL